MLEATGRRPKYWALSVSKEGESGQANQVKGDAQRMVNF